MAARKTVADLPLALDLSNRKMVLIVTAILVYSTFVAVFDWPGNMEFRQLLLSPKPEGVKLVVTPAESLCARRARSISVMRHFLSSPCRANYARPRRSRKSASTDDRQSVRTIARVVKRRSDSHPHGKKRAGPFWPSPTFPGFSFRTLSSGQPARFVRLQDRVFGPTCPIRSSSGSCLRANLPDSFVFRIVSSGQLARFVRLQDCVFGPTCPTRPSLITGYYSTCGYFRTRNAMMPIAARRFSGEGIARNVATAKCSALQIEHTRYNKRTTSKFRFTSGNGTNPIPEGSH